MSNDRGDRQGQSAGPKPLSAVSVLKLLVAQGAGAKFEIQPEHIRAFETALEALSFKAAVMDLAAGRAPRHERSPMGRSDHQQRPAPEAPREDRGARGERSDRGERPARQVASGVGQPLASGAAPARPVRAPRPERDRPASGAGAIWTGEEESRLKAGWDEGRSAQELADQSGRSAGACFARLMKLGAEMDGLQARAARHLIRAQKTVGKGNQESWVELAKAEGFVESPAAGEGQPEALGG